MASNNLIMAFDFGMKKIGIAVGQRITRSANPLCIIPARDGVPDWDKLKLIVSEWQPSCFVVGLPINMDGTESEMSRLASRFGRKLSGRFDIPHETIDERLSSFEAKLHQQSDAPVDAVAAQIILETWFSETKS